MVAWNDSIDITVEVAFGEEPKATSPTWTDISTYVRFVPGIEIDRGTSSELSGISPGFLRLRLDNTDRRFDPSYTSGPYFGDLVPMTKIRVVATLGGTTATLFTGFVLGWAMDWQLSGDGTVEVTAVDGSRFVQSALLADSAYESAVLADSPVHYWPFQGNATDLVADADITYANSSYWTTPTYGSLSLPLNATSAIVPDTTTGTSGRYDGSWSSPPTALSFWIDTSGYESYPDNTFSVAVRADDGANTNLIALSFSGATFGDAVNVSYTNWTDNKVVDETGGSYDDEVPGLLGGLIHVALTATSTQLSLMANGKVVRTFPLVTATGSVSAGTYIAFTLETPFKLSHLAFWTTAPTTTQFKAHYDAATNRFGRPYGERSGERLERILDEIGWPAGDRDVDTGDTVQGDYIPDGQTFLDYARQVTDSERGLIFFDVNGNVTFRGRDALWRAAASAPTFSDDGAAGAVKFFAYRPAGNHVDNIRNIVTTSYSTVGAITRKDQTSIDAYGEAREFIDCPTIPDGRTASTLSAYVLRENKDPKDFIDELDCHVRDAEGVNEFDTLAQLELGDIINVEHTPLGIGSQVTRSVMVTGIRHRIGSGRWTVSLFCSAAPTQNTDAPYLTMGDATYGKIGATAGNLIPF